MQIAENQNRKISKFGSILLSPTVSRICICIWSGKSDLFFILFFKKSFKNAREWKLRIWVPKQKTKLAWEAKIKIEKKKIKCINFVCISWSCFNLTLLRSTSTKVPYARNCRQVKRSPMILIMWSWVSATQYWSAWTKNLHFRVYFRKNWYLFPAAGGHNKKKRTKGIKHKLIFYFLFTRNLTPPSPARSTPPSLGSGLIIVHG